MLYPRETATRRIISLDGIWRFRADTENVGFQESWYASTLEESEPMAVPASYNDIVQEQAVRDHVGWVWYQREVWLSPLDAGRRAILRFGSVTHEAVVWVDGEELVSHVGGYLPFEVDISRFCDSSTPHVLTVAVSNVLDWTTVPPGEVVTYEDQDHPAGFKVLENGFDFFNYSGIHRPVRLLLVPEERVEDITVFTRLTSKGAEVDYRIDQTGSAAVSVQLLCPGGSVVGTASAGEGTIHIADPQLWEPGNPFLYTMLVRLHGDGELKDEYRLPVGVRTVEVEGTQFLLNGKPFYFKGVSKHEDSALRGKGADPVLDVRDFNLLKWIGANSFRTAHYPYSEEIMNLADELGLVVIDESPAVGLNTKDERATFVPGRVHDELLSRHKQTMTELVARDKNHPSVVMWSVANEPACWEDAARPYFMQVINHTRKLDPTRPVTVVQDSLAVESKILDLVDVTCMNRYYSWYTDPGRLEVIELQLRNEIAEMHARNGKPIIISEYGADTVEGLHHEPPIMFSEEYQWEMLDRYHAVIDQLDYVIGEHVWNFADFQTKQEIRRVGGNRKGIFTRDRRPKLAARELRRRWTGTDSFGE